MENSKNLPNLHTGPNGITYSQTGIRIETIFFIANYLISTRNQELLIHPERYTNPRPIPTEELINDLLNCQDGESLYELIEDWAGADPISTLIYDLVDAGNGGFKIHKSNT